MKALVGTILTFLSLHAHGACLTIFENPQNLSEPCRLQLTNFLRYTLNWESGSCNAIYSYQLLEENVIKIKYTQNLQTQSMKLLVSFDNDRVCRVVNVLSENNALFTPF